MTDFTKELACAVGAVRDAITVAERVAYSLDEHTSMVKADLSPVTVADYGVQAVVHRHLANCFPGDQIVAEEDADDLALPENRALLERLTLLLDDVSSGWNTSDILSHIGRGKSGGGSTGRFWTLDPIDGTKGFIRGDQYAIALALIEDGQPVLGILGCPRLSLPVTAGGDDVQKGWICLASRDGAVAESVTGSITRTMKTSNVSRASDIVMCESFESGHSAHGRSAAIAADLSVHREPVRMDSQAKYAAVAAGIADVYLRLPTRADYQEKIWDHAAGAYLVAIAGGRVSDVDGKQLDFSRGRTLSANQGIVATAPGVFDEVTRAVNRHVA